MANGWLGILVVAALGLLPLSVSGNQAAALKRLTLEEMSDPAKRTLFQGTRFGTVLWKDATHYIWTREITPRPAPPRPQGSPGQTGPQGQAGPQGRNQGADTLLVEADTGAMVPLFEAARMATALATAPGVTVEQAGRMARAGGYVLDPAKAGALFTFADDLFYYRFGSVTLTRLTQAQGTEGDATFSPDGRQVAFVRANDLYVVSTGGGPETRLTTDGSAEILNGRLDWLYWEEIFGRSGFRAFWWSPDSSRLAFLRLDEKAVPEFEVPNHLPYQPGVRPTRYPKAGDPNPEVRVGIVPASGGPAIWADMDGYTAGQYLVVNVDWTPDARSVAFQVQNREQTWLDLLLADAMSGGVRRVLRESSPAWVDVTGAAKWLKDGSFLWLSERTGRSHLYHCGADGRMVKPLTQGEWDVRSLDGVDAAGGWVYLTASERSPITTDLYRVRLDGSGLVRLSQSAGSHRPAYSPDFSRYFDTWNNATTPTRVELKRADGTLIRKLHETEVAARKLYRFAQPEYLKVKARDGVLLEAMMVKPPDFDSARKYPVLQMTYAGPRSPSVRDAWGVADSALHQLLAQDGVIVWVCDNRTASDQGAKSAWPAYRSLGASELRDIEDGVAWLKQQPYVDGARIGIYGWSYGGFMTCYALTHSKSFAMGIAGAPPTDWRNYDTVYTERYLGLPQNNPEGYTASSPRFAAKDLHGKLLLIHGTMDDNVHLQNTLQFSYALQKAGKPFQMMLYPQSTHGIGDPQLRKHMTHGILEFARQTLQPEGRGSEGARER